MREGEDVDLSTGVSALTADPPCARARIEPSLKGCRRNSRPSWRAPRGKAEPLRTCLGQKYMPEWARGHQHNEPDRVGSIRIGDTIERKSVKVRNPKVQSAATARTRTGKEP